MQKERDKITEAEELLNKVSESIGPNAKGSLSAFSCYNICGKVICNLIWENIAPYMQYKSEQHNPANLILMSRGRCACTGLPKKLEESILFIFQPNSEIQDRYNNTYVLRRSLLLALEVLNIAKNEKVGKA